ncbi:MAG: hypothetical protein ACTSPL_07960, partial [Candidatus Odinarchaeia archaeon]
MNKKKTFSTLLIIGIVALFFVVVVIPPKTVKAQTGVSDTISPRPIVEYAEGTNYDELISIPGSENVSVDLPTEWYADQIKFDIFELTDTRDFIVNGTFDTGSGQSSPPWAYYEEQDTTGLDDGQWNSTGCIYAELPMRSDGTSRAYTAGEIAYWSETITVDRGEVVSAYIRLSYYPEDVCDRSEIEAFVRINGTYVWTIDFRTINTTGLSGQWNSVDQYISPSVFDLDTSKVLKIDVGVRYTSGGATYTGWTSQNRVYFDNVSLVLKATIKPSEIDLKVKEPSGNEYSVQSTEYGVGQVEFGGYWGPATQPVFEEVSFQFIANTSETISIDLKTNVTVYAYHNTSSDPVSYNIAPSENASLSLAFITSMRIYDQPIGNGPTKYRNYYFNLTLPSDWNITKIYDPDLGEHNPGDVNYDLYVLSGAQILKINVSNIGIYGRYSLTATSYNYLHEIQLQVYNGTAWVNSSTFNSNDTIRFIASVKAANGSVPLDLGNVTITIKDPLSNSWPAGGLNASVNTSGVIVSDNTTVSPDSLIGVYTVEILWENDYEVGFNSTNAYGKTGAAYFVIIEPNEDGRYKQLGESIDIAIKLYDSINDSKLSNIVVQCKGDWETSWTNLIWTGEEYIGSIDIPETLSIGIHQIDFRILDEFYYADVDTPTFNITAYSTGSVFVQLQVYENGNWVNASKFNTGDIIRFMSWITDEAGIPADIGSLTLTILDPDNHLWPTFSGVNVTIVGNVGFSDNITVSNDHLTGAYTIIAEWTGGYLVGSNTTSIFGKIGSALLQIISPTPDSLIQAGTTAYLSLNVIDPLTGDTLDSPIVTYRGSWESENTWHTLSKAIGEPYTAAIPIPEDLPPGEYVIYVNVSHDFYTIESTYSIKVQVWQEWYITIPGVGRVLGWVFVSWMAIAGATVVGGLYAWNWYFRYPPIVRKIRAMRKSILKGKLPKEIKVRTREELIKDLLSKKVETIPKLIEVPEVEEVVELPAPEAEAEIPEVEEVEQPVEKEPEIEEVP